METFVAAIDQGTTGTSLHRLSPSGAFFTGPSFSHRQIFPRPGWVEHDPEEIVAHIGLTLAAAKGAAALGLANQGETIVAWDARTKRPIHNAIVWQDARTQERISALKAAGHEARVRALAGLPLDPYFSASKLAWILDHVPEAHELRREKRLRLGTSDAFFLDRLGGAFVTDVATASRTSLMHLGSQQWNAELCDLFGVPLECLPRIVDTTGEIAEIGGIPVTAASVDQQAALFGHGCRRPGDAKFTFGTGAFALALTGPEPSFAVESGLLPTLAWRLAGEAPLYGLDGGIYNAASAVDWARGLGLFQDFAEIESFPGCALARGLAFVPALSGLAAPHWDRSAAGLWLGLGLETGKRDLMQALLEGIAFRARQIILAMDKVRPVGAALSIDGGLSQNGYFRSFLATLLQRRLSVPATVELTGYGMAQLAMLGGGLAGMTTLPSPTPAAVIPPGQALDPSILARFEEALARCRNWRA